MAGGESPTLSLRNANGISHSQSYNLCTTFGAELCTHFQRRTSDSICLARGSRRIVMANE